MTRGRPKPPSSYEPVTIRFQPAELAWLRAGSAATGVSINQLVRGLVQKQRAYPDA